MSNVQAMATSFKQDILNGLHAFGPSVIRAATTADSFKAALYFATGSIGAATNAYSATSEVIGTNYIAGGVAVTMATSPSSTGTTAFVTPSASIVFTNITISSNFDCALIYNNTAAGRNAVSSHTFTAQTITAGTLTLSMPSNDYVNALIRIA